MLDLIIKNADILTMDELSPVIRGGAVGVRDGKLVFTAKSIPAEYESEGAKRVIDARGNIVMPGLINTHAHAAMCVMRGYADDYNLNEWLFSKIFPVEARLTREAVLAGVRLGIAEMLASGTTSFSDMYSNESAAAQIVLETGIRANLSNGVIALSDSFDFEADRAAKELRQLIRIWHGAGGGRILADASIHAEYTSPPWVWQKEHEIAAEYGLTTHIHLCETENEVLECKARHGGRSPVEVFNEYGIFDTPVLAAHCVWLSEADMRILAEKGVSAAHCPASNLKLASGIANVRTMTEHGINVSLGTDGCASNNSHDLFEEIKFAALLSKGTGFDPTAVPAYQALQMATLNGAKAQGRKNVGMLRAGCDADLIMLDVHKPHMQPVYSPAATAAYSAGGSDVCLTMVQGRILYENGEWTTIDVEKAIAEVKSIAVPIVLGK